MIRELLWISWNVGSLTEPDRAALCRVPIGAKKLVSEIRELWYAMRNSDVVKQPASGPLRRGQGFCWWLTCGRVVPEDIDA